MPTKTKGLTVVLRSTLPPTMAIRGRLKAVVKKAIANACRSQACELLGLTFHDRIVLVSVAVPAAFAGVDIANKIRWFAGEEVLARLPIFELCTKERFFL